MEKILLQIDHDSHANPFDSIVAIDAGVDRLLTFSDVTQIDVESIIYGAIFTRGAKDLHNTAIFFGGSNVEKTIELFEQAQRCFFGPLRVSMMADPNGSNTTAVAAVLRAQQELFLEGQKVTVLGGTGPIGQRIGQLASAANAKVQIASRSLERAIAVCDQIDRATGNRPEPVEASVPAIAAKAVASSEIVFAAGAAGVELLSDNWLKQNDSVRLAVDVNAVPPGGIAGVEPTDAGTQRHGKICFGAIGVGQLKMKIHKASIARLFESNDSRLDLAEIFQIGQSLSS